MTSKLNPGNDTHQLWMLYLKQISQDMPLQLYVTGSFLTVWH